MFALLSSGAVQAQGGPYHLNLIDRKVPVKTLTADKSFENTGIDGRRLPVVCSDDGTRIYVANASLMEYEAALGVYAYDPNEEELSLLQELIAGLDGIDGLRETTGLRISPDGRFLYSIAANPAASDWNVVEPVINNSSISTFAVDSETGMLTQIQVLAESEDGFNGLSNPRDIVISPDGNFIYVCSVFDENVVVFSRDPATGLLTYQETFGHPQLCAPSAMAITPDGSSLYVATSCAASPGGPTYILQFTRDSLTGALTYVGRVEGATAFVAENRFEKTGWRTSLALSSDGATLYYTYQRSHQVSAFDRDRVSGALTHLQTRYMTMDNTEVALRSPSGTFVSADESRVFVWGKAGITVYDRDASTGLLAYDDDVTIGRFDAKDYFQYYVGLARTPQNDAFVALVSTMPTDADYSSTGALAMQCPEAPNGAYSTKALLFARDLGYNFEYGDYRYRIESAIRWPMPTQISISWDGRFLYTLSEALRVFSRDSASGHLELLHTYVGYANYGAEGLDGFPPPNSSYYEQVSSFLHVPHQGNDVYISGTIAPTPTSLAIGIQHYRCNPLTGSLSSFDRIVFATSSPLDYVDITAFSSDGMHLYMGMKDFVGTNPPIPHWVLEHFVRDPVVGSVNRGQTTIVEGSDYFGHRPRAMALSQNGRYLYYAYSGAGKGLLTFAVDETTGNLSYIGDGDGTGAALYGQSMVRAPGADHFYLVRDGTSNILQILATNPSSGLLTKLGSLGYPGVYHDEDDDYYLLGSKTVVSPEGTEVITTSFGYGGVDPDTSNYAERIRVFERNPITGGLTEVEMIENGTRGFTGLRRLQIAASPDGAHVYVTTCSGIIYTFARHDEMPPLVNLGAPSNTLVNGGSVTFDVEYTWPDFITLSESDLSLITVGTVTGDISITETGPWSRLVTVSNINGDGTFQLAMAPGTASDAAGNLVPAPQPSAPVTVDTTPPQVDIGPPSYSLTHHGPITYLVTISGADMIALNAADISLSTTGTATGSISVSGSGTQRTVTIDTISGNGTLGITIASGVATDMAGNASPTFASTTFAVDENAPWLEIGPPSTTLTTAGPVRFDVAYYNVDAISLVAGNITLHTTGTANADVLVERGAGSTCTVLLYNVTGDGSIAFTIVQGTGSNSVGDTPAAGPAPSVDVDNTPPILTLLGHSGTPIEQFQPYSDAGATAVDAHDGDLTSMIVASGLPVDTSVLGDYYIVYTITDAAGNMAPPVVRTVTVFEIGALPLVAIPLFLTLAAIGFLVMKSRMR